MSIGSMKYFMLDQNILRFIGLEDGHNTIIKTFVNIYQLTLRSLREKFNFQYWICFFSWILCFAFSFFEISL